jgi:HPt (histidine-containing phosphotransfer) domain-containing protein
VTQNLDEYFASEAGEYLELMERALTGEAPEPERLARLARGVRGSAQLAGAGAIASVAERLEWAARAAAEGEREWDAQLQERLARAAGELRSLVELHGDWGQAEEERARALAGEWSDVAEPRREAAAAGDGLSAFVARELTGVVATLDATRTALSRAPAELEPLRELLRRTRALRGVTGAPPLAPVLEVLETLEAFTAGLAASGAGVDDEGAELLSAAREALAAAGREAAGGGMPGANTPEQELFRALRLRVLGSAAADDPRDAVPVEELFGGGGVHLVSSPVAPSPESQGAAEFAAYLRTEGLRHLERARAALPDEEEERVDAARPGLLEAALAVRALAITFGHAGLAEAAARAAARLQLSPTGADAAGALAALREALPSGDEGAAAPAAPSPATEEEGEPVPMEDLLLRGERALEAALALRGRALALAGEEEGRLLLEEIFDLLELARTEESVL